MRYRNSDRDTEDSGRLDEDLSVQPNRISSIEPLDSDAREKKHRMSVKPVVILSVIAAVLIAAVLLVTTYIFKGPDIFSPSKALLPFDAFQRDKSIQSENIHVKRGIESYEKGYISDAITEFTNVVESDAIDKDKAIALMYMGIIQDDKGKYSEAIEFFNRALRYDKENPWIYKNLSQSFRHNKDYASATEYAEKSLAFTKDDDANSRILLGNIYYEQGKYKDAIEQYDSALKLEPEKPAVLYNKASALLKSGDEFAAMENFEKAGTYDKIGEVAYKAYSRLGVMYLERNIYDNAEKYLQKAVSIRPGSALSHYNLGIAYLKLKRTKDAMEEFTQAEKLGEENAAMLENLGEAYFSMKDYDKSLKVYSKVAKIDARNIRILSRMAEIYYDKGNLDKAYDLYSRVAQIEPATENARLAYLNMGNIMDDAQRFDEAIVMYEHALAISPKDDSTYYNLGLAYLHAGKSEKAVDSWKKGAMLNEQDPKFMLAVANLYYDKSLYDLAESEYQTVVNRWPNVQEGHFKLATIYYKRGNYQSALNAYNKVIEINDTNDFARIAYINSALLYSKVTKTEQSMEKSVQILQKALLLKPGDPEALFSLGILYERKEMNDRAIETFYQVLKGTSDSKLLSDTYNHIGRCYYKKKQYKKALQAFTRGIDEDPMNEEIRMNRKVAQKAYESELAREQ